MPPPVLIAHAPGEEALAEQLAEPIRAAGYEVAHRGTVMVGESVVADAAKILSLNGPVVLCGTVRAMGTSWARRVVNAARPYTGVRVFIVQMEEEADVESIAFGETVARYWENPAQAVERLIAALQKYYPLPSMPASRDDLLPKVPSGWLAKHLQQTENGFLNHLSGMDKLTRDQASARYVELLVEQEPVSNELKQPARPLAEYVTQRSARLVLLGEGGAGKTTSLLRMAFDAARRAGQDASAPIPIYAKLNFFDAKDRGFDKLIEICAASTGLSRELIVSLWRDDSRALLFLLDGFNEIGNDFQRGGARALEELLQRPQHLCVITSRPTSQVRLLVERCKAQVLSVVQLDDRQVADFLARHGAPDLYEQLSSELKDLVRRPFLLWALAQSCVGLTKPQLPKNKGQLYRNLFDRYLFETHEQRKEPSPTAYNYELVKKPILASLSIGMTREGVTRKAQNLDLLETVYEQLVAIRAKYAGTIGVKPYELMPDPSSAKELLDETVLNGVLHKVEDTIEFMHQSVQDYFAAVGMLDWDVSGIRGLTPPLSLRNAFEPGDGFEAIVMLAGLQKDASGLLEMLAGQNPLLAAHCYTASASVSPQVRDELLNRWGGMLHQQNPEYRKLACACLETARLGTEALQQTLVDLALSDREYGVRTAATQALEKVGSDDTVQQLVERALRQPCTDDTLQAIGWLLLEIDLDAAVATLFDEWRRCAIEGEERRRVAILLTARSWKTPTVSNQLLKIRIDAIRNGRTDMDQAAKELLAVLESQQQAGPAGTGLVAAWDARRQFVELTALSNRVPRMSTADLIQALNQDNYVAGEAASEISKRGAKEGTEPIVEALYRQHISINVEPMVRALEGIDPVRAKELLRAGLSSSDFAKQARSAVALGLMGDLGSMALVQQALTVENPAFRRSAAKVLGMVGSVEAAAALADAAQSENDEEVLRDVLLALRGVRTEAAAKVLFKLLVGRDSAGLMNRDAGGSGETLKQVAGRALLDAVGVHQAIAWLKEAAQDRDSVVRARALDELSTLGDAEPGVVGVLRDAWSDPSGFVRAAALQGIATIVKTPPDLQPLLEKARSDPDAHVRAVALDEWANREVEGAQAALIESAVTDPDPDVRNVAASKLRQFVDPAVTRLSEILQEADRDRQIAALKTLETMGSANTYFANGGYSHSSSFELSDERRQQVLTLLEKSLTDKDADVRMQAAVGLISIGGEDSKTVAIPVLVDLAWHSESNDRRQKAANELKSNTEGREALYKPIWDLIDDPRKYSDIITLIGEEQPFLQEDGYLFALRGLFHYQLKHLDQAQRDYETALKLGFDNTWSRKNRASLLAELGRNQEALETARKVVEDEPGNAEGHLNLGWYAYVVGDYQQAIGEAKIAAALDPTMAMASFNLGLAYIAAGQVSDASAAYDQAITVCEKMSEADATTTMQGAQKDLDDLLLAKPGLASQVADVRAKLSVRPAGRPASSSGPRDSQRTTAVGK